jgi:hypothetical protein
MRIARLICSLLLAVGLLAIPAQPKAQVAAGISVRIGPPLLPVYAQPICPGPGFIWVPGYWAYGTDGYFWVPGTWVEPPEVGFLWTPGYWEWVDDAYVWHAGYWGPEVGFYGGINYGFGYTGVGFFGGYWRGGTFFYNRAVTNVDVNVVRNTYNTTVVNNTTLTRVSYNAGPEGTPARPTPREIAAQHQRHISMTPAQKQHQQTASTDRTLLASVNHGRPDVAATVRPGQFNSRGALETQPSRSVNPNRPTENRKEASRSENPVVNGERAKSDRPPSLRPPNTAPVNPALQQKHQREQDQLRQKQAQESRRIEQKHQQEQQRLQQHAADDQKRQDTQRRQQQELQQLERKHEQQQQKLQQKQQQERQRQKPEKPSPSKPSRNEKPSSQE